MYIYVSCSTICCFSENGLELLAKSHIICSVALDLLQRIATEAKVADSEIVVQCIRIISQVFKCHSVVQEKTSQVEVGMCKAKFLKTTPEEYTQRFYSLVCAWSVRDLKMYLVKASFSVWRVELTNANELKVYLCINLVWYFCKVTDGLVAIAGVSVT